MANQQLEEVCSNKTVGYISSKLPHGYLPRLIIYLLVLAVIVYGIRFFIRNKKSVSIRQCSYGNKELYKIFKDTSSYSSLKYKTGSASSFEERYFISVSISHLYPIPLLEKWVSEDPRSADALLCYGARLVQWSWEARGYGLGAQVSEKKWKIFFDRLEKKRDILLRCTEEMPSDPTPWAYLIVVSTWSSDDFEVRQTYFDKAIERDRYNWQAHMHMIIALSEKWGGNNDEMLAFAETAADNAPTGSDLPAILIKAYIEYWKYLDLFENKPHEAMDLISSEKIREKSTRAYMRSLGADNHIETPVSIFARYNTSAWFWTVKDKQRLKIDLDILGKESKTFTGAGLAPKENLQLLKDM